MMQAGTVHCLCVIGAWAEHDRDACFPPCKPQEGVEDGHEAGGQRERKTIGRTGKERTERLRSNAGRTHGWRKQEDVRINPKSQVIDSGREN